MGRIGCKKIRNNGKISIFMIAIIALGLFALPTVIIGGTGQYTFPVVAILIVIIAMLMLAKK